MFPLDDVIMIMFAAEQASEWVIKFNGLSQKVDSQVHVVHISHLDKQEKHHNN